MKNRLLLVASAIAVSLLFSLPALANGELTEHHTTVSNQARTYLVYEPSTCQDKACPVMFMFHGLGSNATQAASAYYDWQATADQNNFLVIYPDSLNQSAKSVWGITYDPAGKHWDIANIGLPLNQRYNSTDVQFFSQMLNELGTNPDYKILKTHVYAVGHSYGAFFSYYLATSRPTEITAFASWAGGLVSYYWYQFPIPARSASQYKTPGILLSSPGDSIVQHQWTLNLNAELQNKGQQHQLVVLPNELNHNWDASKNQLIWDFLLANSPALPTPEPVTVKVNFTKASDSGIEGTNAPVYVTLDQASTQSVSVNLSTNGTATLGADYSLSSQTLTFNPGETQKTINLILANDNIVETNETAVLNLAIASGKAILGNPSQFTYTIIDNTPIPPTIVNFENISASGQESAGGTVVAVKLDKTSTETIKIAINSTGTATQGNDYTFDPIELVFLPGQTTQNIQLHVLSDALVESNETVELKLNVIQGNAVIGTNITFTYTIIDDTVIPPVIINFASASGQSSEGGLPTTISVHKNDNNGDTITVQINLSGSAQETADYTISSKNLVFSPTETKKDVVLTALTDNLVEGQETAMLTLQITSGNAVLGSIQQYQHTINNTTEPPVEEPADWSVKFLATLNNNVGIVWQYKTEPKYNLLYVTGTEQKNYDYSFPASYSQYTPLDVEVSWQSPYYFWWTMWKDTNGNKGLWRRASNQDNNLDKYTTFASNAFELKDMNVDKSSKPFILWKDGSGNAVIQRYNAEGKYDTTFTSAPYDNSGWSPQMIVIDLYNKARVLWTKDSLYRVESIRFTDMYKTWTPAMTIPTGYEIVDLDVGLLTGDQANRLLFVNDSNQAKVIRLNMNGKIVKTFDFSAMDGYTWHSTETSADNKIILMAKNSMLGIAKVFKVNYSTGVIGSEKNYKM